jgi:hypothetical protein
VPIGVLDDFGWVAAPTDLQGAGAIAFAPELADPVLARAGVGGPQFPGDAGYDSTGFTRISTGYGGAMPAPNLPGTETTWRSALDWQHSPTFWILLFALAAVGFLYARVELAGRAGPFSAHAGVGI